MLFSTLIEPADLQGHLADSGVLVLDCRFDLARPEAGEAAWREAHIPGAVYAHLDRDLSGPITPSSGRHPLPAPDALAATVSRWGVTPQTQVVAYDDAGGMYAARLWWLLRWVGHDRVAVLDGGLKAWIASGGHLDTSVAERSPARFVARPRGDRWLDAGAVESALGDGSVLLVDARAADRYAGRVEPIDPVAGHVPGAINVPFQQNLAADGRFLPPGELVRRWQQALGGRDPRTVACMCGSGVTACHNLLALEVAGLAGARLYAGSWSEWIRDPRRPVARGDA
jgi:thiosulfate/3-mercaptopyruvate sulfurtransferase